MNTYLFGILLLFVAACQAPPPQLHPARLASMTDAQLQEVHDVIATASGQQSIALRSQAFATTHILVLEPSLRRTPQGTLASGTTTTRPRTFHLLGNGRECALEDLSTGIRYPLSFPCPS